MFSNVKQESTVRIHCFECHMVHVHITGQNYSQVDDNVIEKTNTCVGVQIHLIVLVIFHATYFNKYRNVAVLFSLVLTVLKGV